MLPKSPIMKSVLLVTTFLICLKALGADPYILSERNYDLADPAIWEHMEFFCDSGISVIPEQLQEQSWRNYKEYQEAGFNKEFTYWFRLLILNESAENNFWFAEILDPNLQEVGMVLPEEEFYPVIAGISKPFSNRGFQHKNFVVPIELKQGDKTTFYFSIKNKHKSRGRLSIRPAKDFMEYALSEYFFLGIFYGIIIIMAIYNLFLFFFTRELVYLYYVLYVICFSLHAFKVDGLGFQFFWPDFPSLSLIMEYGSPLLVVISFALYSQKFLTIGKYARAYKLSLVYVTFIYTVIYWVNLFFFNLVALELMLGITFGIIAFGGVMATRNGDRSARYFLIAFAFLVTGFTILTLRKFHLIPTNVFTIYALNFSFIIEVVIFSLGIGRKFKLAKEEQERMDKQMILQLKENEILKDSLNRELQKRVLKTSRELENKNQLMEQMLKEIRDKNLQINALNNQFDQDSDSKDDESESYISDESTKS